MDNNNNNKYQNDEQIKKNIEQFTSDREKFLNEANQLNIEKKYESEKNVLEEKPVEEKIVEKQVPKNTTTSNGFKNILKKICIILSIIAVIFSLNGLALLIPFYLIPSLLFYILGFYFFILITKSILLKKGKLLASLWILIVAVIIIFPMINGTVISNTSSISEILYDNSTIIHNDNIYYNQLEFRTSTNIISLMINEKINDGVKQNSINSVNINGTKNKVICKNLIKDDDNSIDRKFYFIKNNELYYATDQERNIKKINLKTCKITKLFSGYKYVGNDENDKYMYLTKNNSSGVNIIEYDLDNQKNNRNRNAYKVKKEADDSTTKFYDDFFYNIDDNAERIDKSEYTIDFQNLNIYYFIEEETYDYEYDDDYDYTSDEEYNYPNKLYKLYKNDKVIFQTKKDTQILLINDNKIYVYNDRYIYEINIQSNELEDEVEIPFNKFKIVTSHTNDIYFKSKDTIYKYNTEQNKFEPLLKTSFLNDVTNDDEIYQSNDYNLYQYNNKIFITINNNNIIELNLSNNETNIYKNIIYKYKNGYLYKEVKNKNGTILLEKIK